MDCSGASRLVIWCAGSGIARNAPAGTSGFLIFDFGFWIAGDMGPNTCGFSIGETAWPARMPALSAARASAASLLRRWADLNPKRSSARSSQDWSSVGADAAAGVDSLCFVAGDLAE